MSQEAARKAEREAGQSRVEKEWLITQQKAAGELMHDTVPTKYPMKRKYGCLGKFYDKLLNRYNCPT